MRYYKDTNNKPFVFEDNVTADIIKRVEKTHNTTLTEITKTDYEALIAPTFEELQASKIQEIYKAYNNANQEDIDYMNTTFQADDYSQDLIAKVLVTGSVPDGFFWLDKNNNQVSMTYADLQGLSQAILVRNQQNFVKYQDLKNKAKQATTKEELDAIRW